jgi:hypothetical protein
MQKFGNNNGRKKLWDKHFPEKLSDVYMDQKLKFGKRNANRK